MTLPGFRKGKAPTTIVKKKYEDSVLNEVLEKIVQEKTKELLAEIEDFRLEFDRLYRSKRNS